MPRLVCEICENQSAMDEGGWRLCPDCSRLYSHFVEWVKQHPEMRSSDLEDLKKVLATQKMKAKELEIEA